MPLKPSEPPHCRPTVSAERGAGARSRAIGLSQRRKSLVQRLLHQCRLASGALLIDNQHRLAQLRVPRPQFLHQNARLRVLAAQAQHRCPGHVGVVDVAGQQPAERLRVLACSAAPP